MNVVGPAPRPRLKWLDGLWFKFSASVHVQAEIYLLKRGNLTLCLSLSFYVTETVLEIIEICPTVAVYILCNLDFFFNDSMNTLYWSLRCVIFLNTSTYLSKAHRSFIVLKSFSSTDTPTLQFHYQPECLAPTVNWDETLSLCSQGYLVWGRFNCFPLA